MMLYCFLGLVIVICVLAVMVFSLMKFFAKHILSRIEILYMQIVELMGKGKDNG